MKTFQNSVYACGLALAWMAFTALSSSANPPSCELTDSYHNQDVALRICQAELAKEQLTDDQKAFLHFKIGEAYYWAHRFDAAFTELNTSLELKPGSAPALIRRYWIAQMLNEGEVMRNDAIEALALEPQNPAALFAMGNLRGLMLDTRGEILAYRQALAVDPTFHLARLNYAFRLFYSLAKPEEALLEIDRILATGRAGLKNVPMYIERIGVPNYDFYASTLNWRAKMRLQLKMDAAALEDFAWLIEHEPGVKDAFTERAEYWLSQKQVTKAELDIEAALKIDPWDSEVKAQKLSILMTQQDTIAAEKLVGEIIDQGATARTLGWAHMVRSDMKKKRKDYDGAVADLESLYQFDRSTFQYIVAHNLIRRGYFAGPTDGEYTSEMRIGLEACVRDPECL